MNDIAIEAGATVDDTATMARKIEDFSLKGNMGTSHLLFTVLAFTGPLGVIFGFLSHNLSFGIGVPIAFVVVTGFMLLFSVGFTNMSRRIPRPGAFYTYITMGLGRPIGLGASFLALSTYAFNVIAAVVFGGVAVNNLIDSFASGAQYPWWIWSMLLLIGVYPSTQSPSRASTPLNGIDGGAWAPPKVGWEQVRIGRGRPSASRRP